MQNSVVVFLALVAFSSAALLPALRSDWGNLPEFLELGQEAILRGFTIKLPNGTDFSIGAVTLPLNYLCKHNVTETITCHLCTLDCQKVHNRYGGQCGPHPNNHNLKTCTCNDSPPPSGNLGTPTEQCGALVDPTVDVIADETLTQVLYIRELLLQCLALPLGLVDSAGCMVDCPTNHQYRTGICQMQVPVPTADDSAPGEPKPFCVPVN